MLNWIVFTPSQKAKAMSKWPASWVHFLLWLWSAPVSALGAFLYILRSFFCFFAELCGRLTHFSDKRLNNKPNIAAYTGILLKNNKIFRLFDEMPHNHLDKRTQETKMGIVATTLAFGTLGFAAVFAYLNARATEKLKEDPLHQRSTLCATCSHWQPERQ